jgi:hypothetical protein
LMNHRCDHAVIHSVDDCGRKQEHMLSASLRFLA